MMILRLLMLDIRKMFAIPLMYAFVAIPALFAFNGWFVSIACLVYAYLVPYGIFAYDDNCLAENIYATLPVRREHIVVARYLFALFSLALVAALMALVNTACAWFFSWLIFSADFFDALTLGLTMAVVFISVAFPAIMRLGAQKANNNVLMVFVLIFFALGFYGDRLRENPALSPPVLALFALLAFMVSLQACLRLYKKKELFDYTPMAEVRRAKKKWF